MADDLVSCGYGERIEHYSDNDIYSIFGGEGKFASQIVDPFADTLESRRQLMALAFFHLSPDKKFTLTGDGHFDVYEQLINFVKSKYEQ